ncbi:hypothetical protein BFP76_02750 [Amylibacter kogurei]|uniref:Uncharacterized protein n=1 Tax=Paramylibacter kogurei TaxID=1889778 RepID=A0A2G5K3Q2_9RHOB|nr:hypothetical protein [Amylibacter kogurei]PIB24167.1 hypothetical protein BFP76_02750 [Amylibacter kogurei]
MNRRQFSQSIAALFATPALPAAALATPVTQTVVPNMAYCWADYLTRMHKVCSPQMLAPFLRVDQNAAKIIHAQLVAENYLTASGAAHPNLIARQPKSIPRASTQTIERSQPTKRVKSTKLTNTDHTARDATQDDIPALIEIWDRNSDQTCDDIETYLYDHLMNTIVIGAIGAPVGFYVHDETSVCHLLAQSDAAMTALCDHADDAGLICEIGTAIADQDATQ